MNEKIAKALVDASVVKFGDFTLASGITSPIYVNLRVVPSYPESFAAVIEAFSKLAFIEGIRQAGGIVNDVVIVLDREQGGIEALAKEKVKLHSLIKLKELLQYMKNNNLIDDDKYNEILDYLEQNK